MCISAVLRVCGNAQKIYPKNFQANADPPGNNYCEATVFFRVFALFYFLTTKSCSLSTTPTLKSLIQEQTRIKRAGRNKQAEWIFC